MARRRCQPPKDVRLWEVPRRVRPSRDERAWFGLPPELTPEPHKAAYDKAARESMIPSEWRSGEISRQIQEIPVADVWCEVDVADHWRAALRLVPDRYARLP